MERHNCCVNTKAIIDYVASRSGPVDELFVGLEEYLLGVPDPRAFLSDIHNWVSADICRIMYANARRITGDERVAYHIGFDSVVQKRLGYIGEILVRAIGTPRGAVKRIPVLNEKFNRNKEVEMVRVDRDNAVVRLHWYPQLHLNSDFCMMNQGVYSGMFTVWGMPPGQVVETKCQFDGAPYCEFELQWTNPSPMGRLKLLMFNRRRLLAETLSEIERDKRLLEAKFGEVQNLNQRLQTKVDQLWSIQLASGAILSELNFTKLIPEVLQIFIKEIGYTRGIIMLIDPLTETLRFVEGVGEGLTDSGALADYKIPLSRKHNILVQVVESGRPVVAADTSSLNLNPDNIVIRNFRPQSILIMPLMARGKVIGVLAADRGQDAKARPSLDRDYLQGFANQVALAIENARMYKELRESYLLSIQSLVEALEAKDPYTRGHSERVALYSVRMAERLNLPTDEISQIRKMCLVHDIGKIGVDRMILNKKTKLAESEFELIRRHPLIGHKIIEPLNLTREEIAIVRNHHERFDGQGYPDGLAGEDIPIHVRLTTVCDAFDAMTSDRPYRSALSMGEAIFRLRGGSGSQFDPHLVSLFDKMARSKEIQDILDHRSTSKVA